MAETFPSKGFGPESPFLPFKNCVNSDDPAFARAMVITNG